MATAAFITFATLGLAQGARKANAVKEAGARQAEINRINADQADYDAYVVRQAANRELRDIDIERAIIAEQIQKEEKKISGAAIARAAARGVDAFEGSPLIEQGEIIKDSRKQLMRVQYAAQDAALKTNFNAERQIRNLALEAASQRQLAKQAEETSSAQAHDIMLNSLMTVGFNAYLGGFFGGGATSSGMVGSTSLAIAQNRATNSAFQVPGGGF